MFLVQEGSSLRDERVAVTVLEASGLGFPPKKVTDNTDCLEGSRGYRRKVAGLTCLGNYRCLHLDMTAPVVVAYLVFQKVFSKSPKETQSSESPK